MRYLFVHDAFPGQFVHLMRLLHAGGSHEIVAASRKGSTLDLPFQQFVYDLPPEARASNGKPVFGMEAQGLGYDLYEKLKPLAESGWPPDFIITHASRGASYFLKQLFPSARMTAFFEWYYGGADIGAITPENKTKTLKAFINDHVQSMAIMRDFEQADACYVPTHFQKKQFPEKWHPHLTVQHEGINTALYKPDSDQSITVNGHVFDASSKVITYAARGMEHSRGFPQFMKAIADVQKQDKNVHAVIAAADRICYDPIKTPKGLKGWAEENVDYDPARTHFVGLLPEKEFVKLLQVSSLHTYLSIPFVLSWSVLNAMSVGVPVLASDNAPVREVITDGENGLLVDPNNITAIVRRMNEALDDQKLRIRLGTKARETILARFKLEDCIRKQLALIHGD